MPKKLINTIVVSADVYMQIIAGKAVKVPLLSFNGKIGERYKIVNGLTKTYMERHLEGVLGDYLYWEK